MSNRSFPTLPVVLCWVVLGALISGCGSNSGSNNQGAGQTRTGRVQLSIAWPAKSNAGAASRYIPAYAASIFCELFPKGNPSLRYNVTANRPSNLPSTQQVTFQDLLPTGTYELACQANALPDGQGAAVASGALEIQVKSGMNPVSLTLNSTIKSLLVLGQPLMIAPGQSLTLQSGAFDPNGAGLLLPDGALVWSIVSGSQFGSITAGGKLTVTAAGTIRVQVQEPITKVSAQSDVTVSLQGSNTGLAQSGYPRAGADAANTGRVQGSGATGQLAWSFPLGNRGINTPVLGNNNLLFALQQKGIVYALDATTGAKKWQATLPNLQGDISTGSLLVGDDNTLYVAYSFGVQAYDAATGVPKWTNTDFLITGAANLVGGKLYAPSRDQGVAVIDSRTGTTLTTFPGLTVCYDVAISNGLAYYIAESVGGSSRAAVLNAVSLATGAVVWSKQVAIPGGQGYNGSLPVVSPDGTVYVGFDGISLNAFDGQTGALKGTTRAATTTGTARPAFAQDGSVFFQRVDAGVIMTVHYDALLTQQLGISTLAVRQMSIGPDTVLYGGGHDTDGSDNSAVFALNGLDGTIKWKVPLTAGVPAASTQFGQVSGYAAVGPSGMVSVVSIDQQLYAIK